MPPQRCKTQCRHGDANRDGRVCGKAAVRVAAEARDKAEAEHAADEGAGPLRGAPLRWERVLGRAVQENLRRHGFAAELLE
eukprot:7325178-Prymnesium_polylepis.4